MTNKKLSIIAFLSTIFLHLSAGATILHIQNDCKHDIFVKSVGTSESKPFKLGPGQSKDVALQPQQPDQVPCVWAHTGCDKKGRNCDTSDGSVSLAHAYFDYQSNNLAYYVSQADGYNLPLEMVPYSELQGNCRPTSCSFDIEQNCPRKNKVMKKGKCVACKNMDKERKTEYSRAIQKSCPEVFVRESREDVLRAVRTCDGKTEGISVKFC